MDPRLGTRMPPDEGGRCHVPSSGSVLSRTRRLGHRRKPPMPCERLRGMRPSWKYSALVILLTVSTAACASESAPAGSTPSDASCSAPKMVSDRANGNTLRLCVGQGLRLSLRSTYWEGITSSPDTVLRTFGPTILVSPAPVGCAPGMGCGTLVTEFRGIAAGTATISAHRTSCGEALLCSPDRRSFTLTVRVG